MGLFESSTVRKRAQEAICTQEPYRLQGEWNGVRTDVRDSRAAADRTDASTPQMG